MESSIIKIKNLFKQDLKSQSSFVIAEIGHNHKGSLKIAKELFYAAKKSGASAVKLQKRDNKELYTDKFYNQSYDHKNSYGSTYGKHRDFLEFSYSQYMELKKFAKKININFICTPFDESSVDFLEKVNLDGYKIASADLINTPLQIKIARTKKPIFLSTGGGNYEDIKRAYQTITKINKKLIILHCTASYPAELKDMNLNVITILKKKFPKNLIGLSDHENGIDAASVAYMLGARVFEKHFTLNRAWKGTDHSFSLEPQGLEKLVRNLKRIPILLGSKEKRLLKSEIEPLRKMQKSIVASKNLKEGSKIKIQDLNFKSPGGGLKPYEYRKILNKKINKNIIKDDFITLKDIK